MATDDALGGDNVTIYFAPVGSVGSDLAADAVEYQSYIQSWSDNGGEEPKEDRYVFSDTGQHGTVTVKKAKTRIELEFDVLLRHSTKIADFKKIAKGVGVVGSGADEIVGMIAIQQTDGTNYYWQAWNNVEAISFNTEHEAENEWKGTLKFSLAATTPAGVDNEAYGDANITTDLTSWA